MKPNTDFSENLIMLSKYKEGDTSAKEALINSNLNLVRSIAIRFKDRGVEYEDLVQIGTIGLLKAIEGFDITQGHSFSTYAFPLIMGEIKRYLRDDGIIKVSRIIKKNASIVMKASQEYLIIHGKDPKISDLCRICSLSEEQVTQALEASSPIISLQERVSGCDSNLKFEDTISDDNTLEKLTDSLALHQALRKLSDYENSIIKLRFFKNLTQTETARILDTTQVTISRTEKKIIDKLRQEIL